VHNQCILRRLLER